MQSPWSSLVWMGVHLGKQRHASRHLLQCWCGLCWEAILSWVILTKNQCPNILSVKGCIAVCSNWSMDFPASCQCVHLKTLYLEVGRCYQAVLQHPEMVVLRNQTWKETENGSVPPLNSSQQGLWIILMKRSWFLENWMNFSNIFFGWFEHHAVPLCWRDLYKTVWFTPKQYRWTNSK